MSDKPVVVTYRTGVKEFKLPTYHLSTRTRKWAVRNDVPLFHLGALLIDDAVAFGIVESREPDGRVLLQIVFESSGD